MNNFFSILFFVVFLKYFNSLTKPLQGFLNASSLGITEILLSLLIICFFLILSEINILNFSLKIISLISSDKNSIIAFLLIIIFLIYINLFSNFLYQY